MTHTLEVIFAMCLYFGIGLMLWLGATDAHAAVIATQRMQSGSVMMLTDTKVGECIGGGIYGNHAPILFCWQPTEFGIAVQFQSKEVRVYGYDGFTRVGKAQEI